MPIIHFIHNDYLLSILMYNLSKIVTIKGDISDSFKVKNINYALT